jgi:CRISPR type III-A-associated RAMP protein Csm4
MNPGLVVKLRPAGPWRIGPDSGARNRVDFIYHSDSLYSAVVSAMARLGSLDAWLDATARRGEGSAPPEVCFSSCFPFLDEIGFVVPPRTVWPPVSRALVSARVRWKSARFVPLGVVQAILQGQRLDENHWSVDGASECLVPAGRPGPFRNAVRSSAAVDRLTGATERHSTACIEFRPGAGLWTIVSFADEAAYARWSGPVKAAFRLLADTGFGGERSRGWGRAESPEFIDGILPDMILPPPPAPVAPVEEPTEPMGVQATGLPGEEATGQIPEPPVTEQPVAAPVDETAVAPVSEPPASVTEPSQAEVAPAADTLEQPGVATSLPVSEQPATSASEPPATDQPLAALAAAPTPPAEEPEPAAPLTEPPATEQPIEDPPATEPPVEDPLADPGEPTEGAASVRAPSEIEPFSVESSSLPPVEPEPPAAELTPPVPEAAPSSAEPIPAPAESAPPAADAGPVSPEPAIPEPVPAVTEPAPELTAHEPETQAPEPVTVALSSRPPAPDHTHPHWLLSLFAPAPEDAVDWRRGNYTVLSRGGRIDSPAGSGELKKQIQMVAEGSVLYAPTGPCGSAADVAPDGFVHPVFRAGFAVSIPLPEVS